MSRHFGPVALALFLLAGCATAPGGVATAPAPGNMAAAPAMARDGMLVDAKGITLYVFANDEANSGRSACVDDCAVKWPPFFVKAGERAAGDYSFITRADGKRQWTFRGKPLYYWPEDQEPGDKYGDNYNKVWHVVPPNAQFSATPATGSRRTDGY
jgi:predicted lipoprotein with Yx(FWY)xxD motif